MRSKTVIMVHNIKTGKTYPSAFTDEWQIMVWAADFIDTHIWFLEEV